MSATSVRRAAGFIVFRVISQHFQYLLLQTSYGSNHWTPPKGHLEEGEDALTAAYRETEEEAGLTKDSYEVLQGAEFPYVLEYPVKGKPKKVEYWVAHLTNPETEIKLSDEHINFQWNNLLQSKNLTTPYPDFQNLLERTELYLNANFKH